MSAYVAGDPVASLVSDVMRLTVNVKEGELLQAVTELYTEMERVSRYGFTEAEFGVVKADYERMVQRIFDSRDDRFNQNFTAVYRDNFLYNRPAMDARTEYETDMAAVAALSFEEFNDYVKRQFSDEKSGACRLCAGRGAGPPDRRGAGDGPGAGTRRRAGRDFARNRRGTFASGGYAAEGRPREEDGGRGVRLDGLDTPQRRACRRETYGFHDRPGVPVCPCSRRSVVALRRGDACRTGAGLLYGQTGVAESDAALLRKQLAGKTVRCWPGTGAYENGFSGTSSPKDVETLLQLVYLYLAQPRFDGETFGVVMEQLRHSYRNRTADPSFRYGQEVNKTMYGGSPRRPYFVYDDIDGITLEQLQTIYGKLYGNPGDFTFFITGNVDEKTLRPLVEKYIGSLPRASHRAEWVDDGVRTPVGTVENRFAVKMEQPKVSACTLFTGRMPYTLENTLAMAVLGQLLDIRYTAVMREDKGGTQRCQRERFSTGLSRAAIPVVDSV